MTPVLVARLGGSYALSPLLRAWLQAIEAAEGRIVLVPGGGPFADAVRTWQTPMGFDDTAAHHMALLAMTQYGLALSGLSEKLALADTLARIEDLLAQARVPVWSPWPMLHGAPGVPASWDVTSDSLALWLACAIKAPRVLLVKHATTQRGSRAGALVADGVLDAAFQRFLDAYPGEVWLAGPNDVPPALDPGRPPGWCLRAAREYESDG
jgi:5-(aminomethyl)-3-furanmethanol phosphate kinase